MLKRKLKSIFSKTEADAILLFNNTHIDSNFWYLTDFKRGCFEFSALIVKPKTLTVMTSILDYHSAKSQTDQKVHLIKGTEEFWKFLNKNLSGKIGLNYNFIPHEQFLKIKRNLKARIVDVSSALMETRMVKDKTEISRMKKASEIAEKIMRKIPQLKFKTEQQLKSEIEVSMLKQGSSPSFSSIVAAGKNSSNIHYGAGKYKPKSGDLMIVDIGAKYKNYCSDMTRTFAIRKISDKKKKMYQTVLEAQKLAIDTIKPGAKSSDIHKIAERHIDKAGFKGKFPHSLGHMIGLQVHEGGRLAAKSKLKLEPGMVFTVEPGIYIRGQGGVRVEDMIVVTKNGCKSLTKLKKDLIVL